MKKLIEFKNQAFWISPQGRVRFVTEGETHIGQVIAHPTFFGFTLEEIKKIYNKYNEILGEEGKAREEIIKELIKKGWVRIRKYNKPDFWSVNAPNFNNKIKDAIQGWASYMIKQGEGKYSDVKLDTNRGISTYAISDLASDILYTQESIEIPKNRFKLKFKENYTPMTIKKWKSLFDAKLEESSWSRIIQFILGGQSFAVISAFKFGFTIAQNKEEHEKLRKDIRHMKYGYIEQKSGYTYTDPTKGSEKIIEEESFFIPLINKKDALYLCKKYNQEAILFKDETGFYILFANGKIAHTFKTKRDSKTGIITFNPELLKLAFSQLKKGSQYQKNTKFSYVGECKYVKEYRIPGRFEGLKEGKIPFVKWITILKIFILFFL